MGRLISLSERNDKMAFGYCRRCRFDSTLVDIRTEEAV